MMSLGVLLISMLVGAGFETLLRHVASRKEEYSVDVLDLNTAIEPATLVGSSSVPYEIDNAYL